MNTTGPIWGDEFDSDDADDGEVYWVELPEIEIVKVKRLNHLSLSGLRKREKLIEIPNEVFTLFWLERLDLSGNQLVVIPGAITQLYRLSVLDLSDNEITDIPEAVTLLSNLTLLNLAGNQFTAVPDTITKLFNLTVLKLDSNQIRDVPEAISRLSNLLVLYLNDNQLRVLPQTITMLSNLNVLKLSYNQITAIPEALSRLTNLTRLDLGNNQLTAVPEVISQISNLAGLDLSFNQLTAMPQTITRLSNLTYLNLSGNRITTVPEWLVALPRLTDLYLQDNPIEVPPPEVLNLDYLGRADLKKIRNYYRQMRETGEARLYEAKLLIVGEGGAGKTSLAHKLLNSKYELKANQISTEGIDILRYEFPLQADSGSGHVLVTASRPTFRLNIWDFGGQEIYHATHQFFLTHRSLYLLVADAREQKTDFYYWLSIIALLGEESPVLIVINEKQGRTWPIPESQLRGQFSNLRQTLTTDLASNRGLAEIHRAIRYHSRHLSHVGTPLPRSWVEVRRVMENAPHSHIHIDDYLSICEQHSFTELEDKLQLSSYLHDIGVCLHFQDDPLLKKTLILKPAWGTTAVYKVLDNSEVIKNWGRFSRDDLNKIWHEEEYTLMRDELLRLMMRFGLCYEIPDQDGSYIAPQLLEEDQPTYEWDEEQNLILRYKYSFMPKGILTRFIVAIHPLIADQELVWKSGVVLEKEDTQAEVVEHYGRREIRIRVRGPQRRDLLTIVTHELDKIHATFPRLHHDKLIPCNCVTCRTSHSPHFYRFDSLKRRLAAGKTTVECDESYDEVEVWSLVDDTGQQLQLLAEQSGIPLPGLWRHLLEAFNNEELKSLCMELDVEYDDLTAEGRAGKARELLQHLERQGRLDELVVLVQQLRPGRPLAR